MTISQNPQLIFALSKSVLFQTYHEAFERATGLSVTLRDSDGVTPVTRPQAPSSFCVLMKRCRSACQNCATPEAKTGGECNQPKTRRCFAGLYETALPLCVEGRAVGFLCTGRVLLERPNESRFQEIAREIASSLPARDIRPYEEAFYKSQVLLAEQYEAMIRLLGLFSNDLAACYSRLALQNAGHDASPVLKAKVIIGDHFRSELKLHDIAKRVGVSTAHFSVLFKKVTGLNFVEYVTRLRVEEAKTLLEISNYRISEAAYKAGFQSVSQFNRTFRRHCGVSPRDYRAGLHLSNSATSSLAGM